MRQFRWLSLGLALTWAIADRPVQAAVTPPGGGGPAYEILGKLAVMRDGRRKPLDTLARQQVKQIYGRETIKLIGPDGKVAGSWGPVAAFFDWTVHSDFWDDQDFILVEYLPLKQRLLAGPVKARLGALSAKASTPKSLKADLRRLSEAETITSHDLIAIARRPELAQGDREALGALATKLGEDHKWLSPRELEMAKVTVGGKAVPFKDWFADISPRVAAASDFSSRAPKPSTLEQRAYEAGGRLFHYQAIRGDRDVPVEPFEMVVPRPHNAAYLKFSLDAFNKVAEAFRKLKGGDFDSANRPTALEQDAVTILLKYFKDLPQDDRDALLKGMEPGAKGTDTKVVATFESWLQETADWLPLRVVMESDPAELERAGFPRDALAAFRAAYKSVSEAEYSAPGKVSQPAALALVASARKLGESVSKYPTENLIGLETHFNQFSPFYWAPVGFGIALTFLMVSVLFLPNRRAPAEESGQTLRAVGLASYAVGMLALIGAILMEVYGFSLRVRISGWAPVTNMYETVIWVAMVAPLIGLVFEMWTRRSYVALASAGVALLATVLAYNVPLLDPSIKTLRPVLRSNYWLTIHVLTIVSSYAAFSLAMGLGLIANVFYLTAIYRRSPSLAKLASPLIPGLPLLAAGVFGLIANQSADGPAWLATDSGYYTASIVAGLGGFFTIAALTALAGEVFNRLVRLPMAGIKPDDLPEPTTAPPIEAQAEPRGRPSVAEIRAKAAASRLELDPRRQAMQATAVNLKPLASIIYRVMQVGVLLVAAGTMLGGFWADYSWGRFWGWDPKEVWALTTLIVYLVPLHGRFAGWVNTFGLVCASVVCFMSVLMAWYGVNFVLPVGLHSYGFTEGGGQGIVFATAGSVLAFVAGTAWRRGLASQAA